MTLQKLHFKAANAMREIFLQAGMLKGAHANR